MGEEEEGRGGPPLPTLLRAPPLVRLHAAADHACDMEHAPPPPPCSAGSGSAGGAAMTAEQRNREREEREGEKKEERRERMADKWAQLPRGVHVSETGHQSSRMAKCERF